MFNLPDLSVAWIYADIYEYELPLIHLGLPAPVKLSYLPAETFTGKVIYIYPSLDPKSRTAKVRIEFSNPKVRLKPGDEVIVTRTNSRPAPGTTRASRE